VCCFVIAASTTPYSSITDYTSPRQLQDDEAAAAVSPAKDEDGVTIDDKDEAALMADDKLEEEYQFDDASLMEDHFDSKDFPPVTEKEEKVPEVVYDDFDAIAPGDPARNEGGGRVGRC
jgi:hypothetical protein